MSNSKMNNWSAWDDEELTRRIFRTHRTVQKLTPFIFIQTILVAIFVAIAAKSWPVFSTDQTVYVILLCGLGIMVATALLATYIHLKTQADTEVLLDQLFRIEMERIESQRHEQTAEEPSGHTIADE